MGDLSQAFQIIELDMPALAAEEPIALKPGKYPANSFFGDSQIIAYITARHAQAEFGSGTMTLCKLPRKAEQKTGHALFRIVFAE